MHLLQSILRTPGYIDWDSLWCRLLYWAINPCLWGWPQQSQSETITETSKESMYPSLLMKARVTVIFYWGRHEELIPVRPKVLVGQESKWGKKDKRKKKKKSKATQVDKLELKVCLLTYFQAIKYISNYKNGLLEFFCSTQNISILNIYEQFLMHKMKY